ncbi:hypothetical protein CNMCM5623_006106 [Aspergillus felis]|uniref:Uncharacterized protein n=1 Tax=Aspergillus felis TaxID=1287682 RepID=A0A8H6V187_9EURO|nr:hypothetical protein CNMCM5623_006106 [Aspergillus felis]
MTIGKAAASWEKTEQPWQILRRSLAFSASDHEHWWDNVAPILGKSLQLAQYSVDSQYQHLLLYHTLSSKLGRFPNETKDNMVWCAFTPDFETFNITYIYQNASKCTIRLSFEPVGPHAATPLDPTNEEAPRHLLRNIQQVDSTVNLDCYFFFDAALAVTNDEARPDWNKLQNTLAYPGQRLFAVDLNHDGSFMVSSYHFPYVKSVVTSIDTKSLVFKSLSEWARLMNLEVDFSRLDDYLSQPHRKGWFSDIYLSIDCVDPQKMRMKVHTEEMQRLSLDEVRDCWTLGGHLQCEDIDRGFAILEKIWKGLVDEYPSAPIMKICEWEYSPGKCDSVLTVSISTRHVDDQKVVEVLSGAFEGLGWDDHAQMQREIISEAW